MKIAMVSLAVPDPIKAFKFYTEVLGFVEVMYQPEHQIALVASPEDPKGTTMLLEPIGDINLEYIENVYKKGLPVIIFGTDDAQAEYERLKAKGVVFRDEPKKTDYGIMATFEDTCGNLIQLHQA